MEGFETIDKSLAIIEEDSYEREGKKDYIIPFNEPVGHEDFGVNFDMVVKYFEHEAEFTQKIKPRLTGRTAGFVKLGPYGAAFRLDRYLEFLDTPIIWGRIIPQS